MKNPTILLQRLLDISVILSITLLQWIRRHHRPTLSLDDLFYQTKTKLFSKSNFQSMNESFLNTIKYLCNYGTYRFGLELSFFAAFCSIIIRMDALSLLHAIVLTIFLLLPRRIVRRFWILYRIFASISVIWLYLNALGQLINRQKKNEK